MALKRKRKEEEKRCHFCKVNMTFTTIHGGLVEGSGRRCCNDCFVDVQKEESRLWGTTSDSGMSLGEEQAYRQFGI